MTIPKNLDAIEDPINSNLGSNIEKIYTHSVGNPGNTNGAVYDTTFTVNVASLYPEEYNKFTNNNFVFVATRIVGYADSDNNSHQTITSDISWSYNAASGILTVAGLANAVNSVDDTQVKCTQGYVLLIR